MEPSRPLPASSRPKSRHSLIWSGTTDHRVANLSAADDEILRRLAIANITKEKNLEVLEELKMKKIEIFQRLTSRNVQTFHLIQTNDVLPNLIEQYLDFTYNPFLHTCDPCGTPKLPEAIEPEIVPKPRSQKVKLEKPKTPFTAVPDRILFHNYELNRTYTEKLKLRNILRSPQHFYYVGFPRDSHFRLDMLTDSCKLAPGMYAEFQVTFKPVKYLDCTQKIIFRSGTGVDLVVFVSNSRDPPKLVYFVFDVKYPEALIQRRDCICGEQIALNLTIDCGTCLAGTYRLVCVLMKNIGQKGKFLITTEKEWRFSEITGDTTRTFEVTEGCFTIFPAFFEIDRGDFGLFFILFTPESEGCFTDSVFIICDNNSYYKVALYADCVIYTVDFLKVDMYLLESSFNYCCRTVSATLRPYQRGTFAFSVENKSPINFSYFFALKKHPTDTTYKVLNPDWLKILDHEEYFPSFSTTDIRVRIQPATEVEGVYYTYLCLYLKDVTVLDSNVIDTHNSEELEDSTARTVMMDNIDIFETGIFVTVAEPQKVDVSTSIDFPEEEPEEQIIENLAFAEKFVYFGILPKRVTVSKKLTVNNLVDDYVAWKLLQIQYCDNTLRCSDAGTIDPSFGIIKPKRKQKITYTVNTSSVNRFVSLLVLWSCAKCTCQEYKIDSVCLVVYEAMEYDMLIQTESGLAVLSPRQFIYVGIPSSHKVLLRNQTPLLGCYWFLTPRGRDVHRINVRVVPKCGFVPPNGTVEVAVELLGIESGIIEDFYVPCFIGDPHKIICMKVVCMVSAINVFFHLPTSRGGYVRFLWPPKDEMPILEPTLHSEGSFLWSVDKKWFSDDQDSVDDLTANEDLYKFISNDAVAATYPTVTVKNIKVKKATKITLIIENSTPIRSDFTVSATNYGPENPCVSHVFVIAGTRSAESFWERNCVEGHGITVEPNPSTGIISAYEVLNIDVWMYANTWGTYLEEIIIEVDELTPFCFNLLMEVEGAPLEFPFARNTILPYPTLRFGQIPYEKAVHVKKFICTNTSSIPIRINWHVFDRFNDHVTDDIPFNFLLQFNEDKPEFIISDKFVGLEGCSKCVTVEPPYMLVEKQETVEVSVTLTTEGFVGRPDLTKLKYILAGLIGINDCDKYKENYFRRESGTVLEPVRMEILATLERPVLQLEVVTDETQIDMFVNDILLADYKFPEIYLSFRNPNHSDVLFKLEIDKPFLIKNIKSFHGGNTDRNELVLQKDESLQVVITCFFSQEDLIKHAGNVYKRDIDQENLRTDIFVSEIARDLNVFQQGIYKQIFPFQVRLHYPHLEIRPNLIMFDPCLVFHTKKTVLTIYNLTGCIVKFKIHKTTNCTYFEVQPTHGEIPRTTGANRQFVDVAVYFTPTKPQMYLESLRIETNIPQYYFDIPLAGHGTTNEKFHVD